MDFGVWILDFGFWILDFGLDEALPDIVWILHKIFPCHADSGRRIFSGGRRALRADFLGPLTCKPCEVTLVPLPEMMKIPTTKAAVLP